MLVIPDVIITRIAKNKVSVKAKIIGYKQFPNDIIITDNTIFKGGSFSWLRVVEFINPQNGQLVQMFTNPSVPKPEPIGTELTVAFNPNKTTPTSNGAWVQGNARPIRKLGIPTVAMGLIVYITLLIFPFNTILILGCLIVPFAMIFIFGSVLVWKRPNQ